MKITPILINIKRVIAIEPIMIMIQFKKSNPNTLNFKLWQEKPFFWKTDSLIFGYFTKYGLKN